MKWQPIDSAPKDGSWVLLRGGDIDYGWDGYAKPPCVVGQYFSSHPDYGDAPDSWQFAWYDGAYYGEYENPTEWMPLPK